MELSPREGRFETTRMRDFYGAIRDSMPDAWGRRVIERGDLALVCGEYGRYANRQNLLSGHGHFLLDAREASRILEALVETVRTQWRPALRRAGVDDEDCENVANAFLYPGFFY